MSRLTLARSSLLNFGVMLVTVNDPAFLVCDSSWYVKSTVVTALLVLFKRTSDAAGTEQDPALAQSLCRTIWECVVF